MRYVLATGGNLGSSREEMNQVRAALDPVLDQNPNLQVSAKVAVNHGSIVRKGYRAIASAVRVTTAAADQQVQ